MEEKDIYRLLLDTGGFTSRFYPNVDTLKTEYLLKGFSVLGNKIVNLGDDDLCLGSNFIKRAQKKYDFSFISANVYDAATGHLFVPPYVIKRYGGFDIFGLRFGGIKLGIFGVTCDECLPECPNTATSRFNIRNPLIAASEIVNKLRGKCDVLIALAHLGSAQCKRLSQEIDGIDVVLCSHATMPLKNPYQVRNTNIYQSGAQGKYIGEFSIKAKGKNSATISDHKLTLLDSSYSDSQQLAKIVEEYKNVLQK